jgi:hypothetical protein
MGIYRNTRTHSKLIGMKQKIKFKALTYHGKVVFFIKEFECPDFKVIPPTNFKGIKLPEISVENQIIDWLDGQDKTSLMIEKDLGIIIDYFIPKKRSKFSIIDYLKMANLSEQMIFDLMVVYKEIKPLLKGKSVKIQIQIMFSHLIIGYQAMTNAYQNITAMLQSKSSDNDCKLLS